MSDTWTHARASLRRLKTALDEADEDTRWKFGFWLTGIATMAVALVAQFGWVGALFCAGALLWAAGS